MKGFTSRGIIKKQEWAMSTEFSQLKRDEMKEYLRSSVLQRQMCFSSQGLSTSSFHGLKWMSNRDHSWATTPEKMDRFMNSQCVPVTSYFTTFIPFAIRVCTHDQPGQVSLYNCQRACTLSKQKLSLPPDEVLSIITTVK